MWRSLGELWADLLALVWPAVCVVCGTHDRDLCMPCRDELFSRIGTWQPSPGVTGFPTFVVGGYDGAVRDLLVACKHAGATRFAHPLGELLSGPLRAAFARSHSPPLVVTVPSRKARERERGYRHMELIVRAALRRIRRSEPLGRLKLLRALEATPGRTGQVGLRARERELNAARIRVRRGAIAAVRGKEVVLVDDIITTGATVRAACAVLVGAGAHVTAIVALAAVTRFDRESPEVPARLATHEPVTSPRTLGLDRHV